MNIEAARGHSVVVQMEEALSYWQPLPANGYSDIMAHQGNNGGSEISTGFQTIAVGGRVRAHSHVGQVELQICFRGVGQVVVDGEVHPLSPGTTCLLGPDVRHEIINNSDDVLVMLWVIAPSGLETFFQQIGRLRKLGDSEPEPFERPKNVETIERQSGFRNIGS